jgi:hypothetical protein
MDRNWLVAAKHQICFHEWHPHKRLGLQRFHHSNSRRFGLQAHGSDPTRSRFARSAVTLRRNDIAFRESSVFRTHSFAPLRVVRS